MASAERHKLDETEIAALVQAEIDAAETSSKERGKRQSRAIEYRSGEMKDLPPEAGRSAVTDHSTKDTIGWMLPGLMRTFLGGEQIVVYEPQQESDKEAAKQATEYVNYVVRKECNAYEVFWDAFDDALLHGNGIVKHYWDDTPVCITKTLKGLSEDEYAQVAAADEVEVLEHSLRKVKVPVPTLAEDGSVVIGEEEQEVCDCKLKIEVAKGSLKISAVAPENFLISNNAKAMDTARFVGEKMLLTRSELREMEFDEEKVDKLPAYSWTADPVASARDGTGFSGERSPAGEDNSTDEIEIYETYPLADVDGDGIAERLKVISAGTNSTEVLDWEVYEDETPYSDLVPERTPHRWEGSSVFDDTEDIQRVRTVVERSILDNLYNTLIPDRVVDDTRVKNPDALFERSHGNVIRVEGVPDDVVKNLEVPFTGEAGLKMLAYCDEVLERRTGVSKASMGLDPETLQNQTATADNNNRSASYSKQELVARNFAEMGMKRIFRCILKLVVKHQDKARTIRLRDKWVEMDPATWNADMDATVNVGLGSGSRERDIGFLNLVIQQQKEVLAVAGGVGTAYGQKIAKAINQSQAKLVEATGLKGPEAYFPEITDEELKELASRPNPEVEKLKMEAEADQAKEMAKLQSMTQLEQMRSQSEQQNKQTELSAQAELDQRKAQQTAEIERIQAEADVAVKQRETEAQIALADREFQHKAMLAEREFEFGRELKFLEHSLRVREADHKHEAALAMAKTKANGASPEPG